MFENLESRVLLSASLENGLLLVEGTGANDTIALKQTKSQILVQINKTRQAFDRAAVQSVEIRGGAGKDRIEAKTLTIPCVIKGEAGNDVIFGSKADDKIDGGTDNDQLHGLSGNDTIIGGAGADSLHGEAGNDYFVVDGSKTDRVSGGAGRDRANKRGRVNEGIEVEGAIASSSINPVTYNTTTAGGGKTIVGGSDPRILDSYTRLTGGTLISTNPYGGTSGTSGSAGAVDTSAGSISGSINLTKSGSGSLTLTGGSTYTGSSSISSGSLVIRGGNEYASNTIASSFTLTLSSGTFLASSAKPMLIASEPERVIQISKSSTEVVGVNTVLQVTTVDGITSLVLRVTLPNPNWTIKPSAVSGSPGVTVVIDRTLSGLTGGPVDVEFPIELGSLEPGAHAATVDVQFQFLGGLKMRLSRDFTIAQAELVGEPMEEAPLA